MIERLDHVVIGVRDLAEAARQYTALLGRSPSWRGEHPAAGTANVLFRLENTYLELLTPAGEGALAQALAGWLEARGEGVVALAWGTSDAAATRRAWQEAALEPEALLEELGRDTDSGAIRRWRRVPLPPARTRGTLHFAVEHTSPDALLPPASPLGDARAAVSGLDHAVVRTADAEAALRLYGEALGLRLALDRRFPGWGMRLLFFRVGGVTLEVAAALHGDEAPAEDDRLWGLSYRVPDADAAHARLESLGLDISEVRKGRRPGTRVLSVRSRTCGVPTLLLEPPGEAPQ